MTRAATDSARLRAGNALCCFGCVLLACSIAAAFLLDALTVDVTAVVAICLGAAVRRGSLRAMKWAIALTVYYLFLSAAFCVAVLTGHVGKLSISGRAVSKEEAPWIMVFMVAVCLWSLVNGLLLWQALHEEKREMRRRSGLCANCGYDLSGNTTGRCPECGATSQTVATEASEPHGG
jgi:uncharacterized paraquat-inducible protein A